VAFEKRKSFSIVLPPAGITRPVAVVMAPAASAQVSLQIGSYTTSTPYTAALSRLVRPNPRL
jgi:hypothetical protein